MLVLGPKFNPHRLLKREMLWLMTHRCRHSHFFSEHISCYFDEKPWLKDRNAPGVERVGFLDIESTGLKANWDLVLCYCIKSLDGEMTERSVSPKEIRSFDFDKNVVNQFCKDIRNFDRVVVHFGRDRRHDLPFLRTRALKWGLDFPTYKELNVTDTYDMAKSKLSLHSYRLEAICNFFEIPAKEHKLDVNIWQRARIGDKKSLDWILKHCREDVISLERVWKMLVPFFRGSNTSI